jgi:hypothetical protein
MRVSLALFSCAASSQTVEKTEHSVSKDGSARESEAVAILRGFLKNEKLSSGRGQALRLQQQVAQVRVSPAAT